MYAKKSLSSLIGKVSGSLIALAIAFNASTCKAAENPKKEIPVSAILTGVHTDKGPDIGRVELFIKDAQSNWDAYGIFEFGDDGEYYFTKVRGQWFPIKHENVSLGFAAQNKHSSFFDSYNEFGPALRFQKAANDLYVKMDTRYFPEFDGFWFFDTSKMYGDLTWTYDMDDDNIYVLPSIRFKAYKRVWIGGEACFSGKTDNIDNLYYGCGVKILF